MELTDTLALQNKIRSLVEEIFPGSTLTSVEPVAGDYYNDAYLVEVVKANGSQVQLVIKRFVECGADLGTKAGREYQALSWLEKHPIPAPRALYVDESGEFLDAPSLVTEFIPGRQIMVPANPPADPLRWARDLAHMLAKIHAIPCDPASQSFLLDANAEAVWFTRHSAMPGYIEAHPDGPSIWQIIAEFLPRLQPVPPALVHIDYWPGNVLWENGQISAVIDWEEAAYGDPGYDVAYCRMELLLYGMDPQTSDGFLDAYEAETGRPVANLSFWELAAAVRPMTDPKWGSEVHSPLRKFIANARQKLGR